MGRRTLVKLHKCIVHFFKSKVGKHPIKIMAVLLYVFLFLHFAQLHLTVLTKVNSLHWLSLLHFNQFLDTHVVRFETLFVKFCLSRSVVIMAWIYLFGLFFHKILVGTLRTFRMFFQFNFLILKWVILPHHRMVALWPFRLFHTGCSVSTLILVNI